MTEMPRRIGSLDDDDLGYNDPDLSPPTKAEQQTVLDGLLGDLEKALVEDVTFEPLTLEIEKRPGVAVRYSTQLDDERLTAWRKRAEDKKSPDGVNALRFCLMIVANQCEAILFNGQEVHDEAGQLLTFGHKRIRDLYQAQRAADAARKAIGADPHVMAHANEIMIKAGFGEQAVEIDGEDSPT